MTWIVHGPKTKKELRERLARNEAVRFEDPSFFNTGVNVYTTFSFPIGTSIVCTNHPKRSWFAKVTRTDNGYKVE